MKKQLRIAMFISSDPAAAGGVQEHVYYLSTGLRKLGHTVDLFGCETSTHRFEHYRAIGYRSMEMPSINGNWGSLHFLKPEIHVQTMFTKQLYDILHVHGPYYPFAAWELIQNTKIPKVATFHDAWDDPLVINTFKTFFPLLKKNFSEHVQGGIFVSEVTKKTWSPLCSRKMIKQVIHNGIDPELYRPAKKTDTENCELLYVGRLIQRKGIHFLLKSFHILAKKHPHIRLSIMGIGPELDWCNGYIKSNKLQFQVRMLGEIFGPTKVTYYQNADIFCAPYSNEAFAITVLEAIGCGCTIVGFRNGATKEILKDYPAKNLLVKSEDGDGLTQALENAILDKNLRQKVKDYSATTAQKYSWDPVTTQTESIYYRILSPKTS